MYLLLPWWLTLGSFSPIFCVCVPPPPPSSSITAQSSPSVRWIQGGAAWLQIQRGGRTLYHPPCAHRSTVRTEVHSLSLKQNASRSCAPVAARPRPPSQMRHPARHPAAGQRVGGFGRDEEAGRRAPGRAAPPEGVAPGSGGRGPSQEGPPVHVGSL